MPDDAVPDRLGDLIAELDELIIQKEDIDRELDPIEKRINQLKGLIIAALDAAGTTQAKNTRRSVSISETETFKIADDEAFHNYVVANDAWHLFKREVVSARVRELNTMGDDVPGLAPFTVRRLNVSKVKTR